MENQAKISTTLWTVLGFALTAAFFHFDKAAGTVMTLIMILVFLISPGNEDVD